MQSTRFVAQPAQARQLHKTTKSTNINETVLQFSRANNSRVDLANEGLAREELARDGLPSGNLAMRESQVTHSQESVNLDFDAFTKQLKEQRRQVRKEG